MPAGPRTTPYPVVVQFSDPTNPTTPVKLLESSSLFVNNLSAVTISATNYLNLPNIGGVTSVNQLDGTGIFVLSSTNNSLSSLVSNIELSTIALSAYIAANESNWAATGGGAGASYLSSLLDVDVTSSLLNGDLLFYNSSIDKWTNLQVDPNGVGSVLQLITDGDSIYPTWVSINLNDLGNVSTTPAFGDTLYFSSNYQWVNIPAIAGAFNTITPSRNNSIYGDQLVQNLGLGELEIKSPDDSIVPSGYIDPTYGYLTLNLTVNSSAISLSSLGDTNVTSLTQGNSLVWDGSYWVPSAIEIPVVDLLPYVLTSTNSSLSSIVTGHINDGTIHFTSGSLSSAYALSSWVSNNFIDNTEITQYATTGSLLPYALTATLSNYLLTSVNVTSLAGTGVFALTGTIALSSLRDVTITNPQTYQVLTWNGTAWQPSAVAGGAGGSPGGSTTDIQYNAGGGSFGGTNGLTWTAGSQLLSAVNIYSVNASAATISATNYLNLPNFATTATNVTSFQGTGIFETTGYARVNYATTAQLQSYVLTSTNLSLSSTVTGHIADGTIHFTSGSLSSAYALSSWVSNNFIDNTEILQYATTASLTNYLLTSVNVTSLAGTSTFETTGYARVNYATTGQLQSYVLTSTNLSLSTLVTNHLGSSVHWELSTLNNNYINASGDSANAGFYLSSVSAINISATNYYNLPSASFPWSEAYTVVLYVKNNSTSVAIPKGTPVAIVAAAGDVPKVSPLSSVNNHVPEAVGFSNHVAGLAKEIIAADGFGHIVVEGILEGTGGAGALSTDQFVAGDWLYVSSNGQLAATRPPAPYESHPVGIVLRAQQNTGKILVKIENVSELNDIVGFNLSPTLINGDLISYDLTTSTFKNVQALNISGGSRFGSVSSTNISATNYYNLPSGTALWNANKLQGRDVTATAPRSTSGQNLIYDGAAWKPGYIIYAATATPAGGLGEDGDIYIQTVGQALSGLTDVSITSVPSNGQALVWSSTRWVPSSIAGGSVTGGGSPGGSDYQIQFKNGASFSGVDQGKWLPAYNTFQFATLYADYYNGVFGSLNKDSGLISTAVSTTNLSATNYSNLPSGTAIWNANKLQGYDITIGTPFGLANYDLLVYVAGLGWLNVDATTWVNALPSIFNANKLQNVNVSSTTPTTGDVLTYNGTGWRPANTAGLSMLISNGLITG